MDFLDLAKKRQSVRDYLDKPVEHQKIERCLEAARLAPSACNSQPWRFIIVDEPSLQDALAKETFGKIISLNHFTVKVPVLVAIISEPPNLCSQIGGMVKKKAYHLFDIGIAAEHFCLQAVDEGLGTCILGWFDQKGVKKLLKIPRSKEVALIISLGYPASLDIKPKVRKSLADIISYNQY